MTRARSILAGQAQGRVIASAEGLSFWGGVDPETARVIDVHHPLHGICLSGAVLMMPTSRGSCSGSGVMLDLALTGRAPAALVFSEPEDVLTLGALIAAGMFDRPVPVLRLPPDDFARLAATESARITPGMIEAEGMSIPLAPPATAALDLTPADRGMLDGHAGAAVQQAMRILCAMAAQQGATRLTDVTQAHIDGCIYAHPANLVFAERMADLGARVAVPTTINAISVDMAHWREQGVPPSFGGPASRLAEAYLRMGCRPSFTCAPYLLDSAPGLGEPVGWAESNAVVYANSVLGARTAKHPDYLDLCIALTGRVPLAGVYLAGNRVARRVIAVDMPDGADDAFWPLAGYLAGLKSPDRIPLLRGLAGAGRDDLKALCAAFGTTSAAPMLMIEGITPETATAPDADRASITRDDMAGAWRLLNEGPETVVLIAIGSPHASLAECRALAAGLCGRQARIPVIVTTGRQVIAEATADGTLAALTASGVKVLPDLCWCSITEPVFPPEARNVMTNSGKYAHYGPGLSGRTLRFGGLADCVQAALTGQAPQDLPRWLGP